MQLNELFEKEKFWLEKQKGMEPWETGKVKLEAKIKECVEETIAAFFEDVQVSYRPDDFLPRFWACVNHHWQVKAGVVKKNEKKHIKEDTYQRSVSFDDIIKHLREIGRGDQDSPFVKPNIEMDKSIAQTTFPDVAYTVFYANDHSDPKLQIIGITMLGYYIPFVCTNETDWDDDQFEEYLKENTVTKNTGEVRKRILVYMGQGPLKDWLKTTAWRFFRSRRIETTGLIGIDIQGGTSLGPEEVVILGEGGNRTQKAEENEETGDEMKNVSASIFSSINNLPDEPYNYKYIAQQYLIYSFKGKEIAKQLGINPGTVSRRLDEIIEVIYNDVIDNFIDKYEVQFPPSNQDEEEKLMKRIKKVIKDICYKEKGGESADE